MRKQLFFYLLFAFFVEQCIAQSESATTTAPIKTFATASDKGVNSASSVNLFTGDVAMPLNLISLPGRSGLDVNVSFSYSSNVQNVVGTWNLEAPTGIIGLGWSMDIPKIVCDHKQTGTREDDEFYLIEGGSANKLVRTGSGAEGSGNSYTYKTYSAKNYQFWKIKYYTSTYIGYAEKWEITKEDGTKYIYGDPNSTNASGNNRNTVQYVVRWGNWIGNSAVTNDPDNGAYLQAQMVHIWNLSEIVNTWGEKITFEYDNVESKVGSNTGNAQTEASYLKQINDVLGRKVIFNYLDKADFKPNGIASQFYMEPHTEKATEPDGYQEFYERKYLDKIDVIDETNTRFLTVQLGYGVLDEGTNRAKMLLTSIMQKNKNNNSLPGMQFSYRTTGNTKGFLEKVTYPQGGYTLYSYNESGVMPGHTQKQLAISAPAGYAEPQVYISDEDYVVVFWRKLNADGTHDKTGQKQVVCHIYQWVGEWKKITKENSTEITYYEIKVNDKFEYQDFQVVMEKDFFAILAPQYANPGYFTLNAFYKDETKRGVWNTYIPSSIQKYGDWNPALLSGDKFVAAGVQEGIPTNLYTYTLSDDNWTPQTIAQPAGHFFYTATNNFIISHNRDGADKLYFNYLSEDKKWVSGLSMNPQFGSANDSFWHVSNSFAVGMVDNNPEYIFGWDVDFSQLIYPGSFKRYDNVWGSLGDQAPVSSISNTSFAYNWGNDNNLAFKVARFNGAKWETTSGNGYVSQANGITFGDDYVVFYNNFGDVNLGGAYDVNMNQYDANLTSNPWIANTAFNERLYGITPDAKAGPGNLVAKNKLFLRQPNGSWINTGNYTSSNIYSLRIPSTKYYTYVDDQTILRGITNIQLIKNGEPYLTPYQVAQNPQNNSYSYALWNPGMQYLVFLVNGNTIVTTNGYYANYADIKNFLITRVEGGLPSTGGHFDYPVTKITENDGIQDRYTYFDYTIATATTDPSTAVALYNKVVTISGVSSAPQPNSNGNGYVSSTVPYGYTVTYFYNGLSTSEDSNIDVTYNMSMWMGLNYKSKTFDNNNIEKSSSESTVSLYSKDLFNNLNVKIAKAYYVRPTDSHSKSDGIETYTSQWYDENTGLVKGQDIKGFNSKDTYPANFIRIENTYFWEIYDVNRTTNILSPVVRTKKTVFTPQNTSGQVAEVTATTWKQWAASNVWAPHKSYIWKRAGTSDFNFTNWSGTSEPLSTDPWKRVSLIDAIDDKGNVLQTTNP